MKPVTAALSIVGILLSGCTSFFSQSKYPPGSFGNDADFVSRHFPTVTLTSSDQKAKVLLVPAMQGRVMTSSASGISGKSFGWLNRELIASGKTQKHINAYGGEDRFWLGPEGGQFSVFFENGSPFDLAHWQTPPAIDTEPFELVEKTSDSAVFRRTFTLKNYTGFIFHVQVDRTARLIPPEEWWSLLGSTQDPSVQGVAVETINRLTNTGKDAWKKETGCLSIWILGMLNPAPALTVVIPIREGSVESLGPQVNSDYFGKVPADRLVVTPKTIFFKGDGNYRSKIGINPKRATPVMGSYDATDKVLTVVQYTLPPGTTDYVNSMWEIQKTPYAGDTINSYNDGPASPGAKPMGPFYELESSSPAAALQPGETMKHIHRTMHLTGPEASLDKISRSVLGVSLKEITNAFPSPSEK